MGDTSAVRLDLVNLAGVEIQFRCFESALSLISRARSITVDPPNLSLRARIAGHEATALLYVGKIIDARKIAREAIGWSRNLGDHSLERWLALKICLIFLSMADAARAEHDARYNLQQANAEAGPSERIEWLEMSARVILAQGTQFADQAHMFAKQGLRLAKKSVLHRYNVLLYLRLAQSLHALGNNRAAKNAIKSAWRVFQERGEPLLEQDDLLKLKDALL